MVVETATGGSEEALSRPRPELDETTPCLYARYGSFLLRVPDDESVDFTGLSKRIAEALATDSRVSGVEPYEPREEWDEVRAFWPLSPEEQSISNVIGGDGFGAFEFSRPVAFSVRIPKKNQYAVHDFDSPAEEYFVRWNGITAVVSWVGIVGLPPVAGGHAIIPVLKAAAAKVGCGLEVQACNPSCEFGFAHSVLAVIDEGDDNARIAFSRASAPLDEVVFVHGLRGPEDISSSMDRLHREVRFAIRERAILESYTWRLQFIHQVAGDRAGQLAILHEHIADQLSKGWRQRLVETVRHKGWRRQARAMEAAVWAGLAAFAVVRGSWDQGRGQLDSDDLEKIDVLYGTETDLDRAREINVDAFTTVTTRIADNLNSRFVGWATAAGGLAGAVAGAVVTAAS